MKVIQYFKCQNQKHWNDEIAKADWSAAQLLYSWLDDNKLKQMCGRSADVYLLTDDDKLISFAVLAEQDEIDAPEMFPWIGFVYTFEKYRGHHYAGVLMDYICTFLKAANTKHVYISTQEVGLYEKYGFAFLKMMTNREGEPTRVYTKNLV